MVKKTRDPRIGEGRDPKTNISTENHRQMFDRLVAAGVVGIHNKPGEPKKHRKAS
jgi:hypothetical protein